MQLQMAQEGSQEVCTHWLLLVGQMKSVPGRQVEGSHLKKAAGSQDGKAAGSQELRSYYAPVVGCV